MRVAVGAVAFDHVIGRNDVAQALGHFRAALDDHALGEEALGGFVILDQAHVAHEFGPEARVNQVQDRMFYSADVLVDAMISEPVACFLAVERSLIITGIGVAIEVPGRVDKRVHRVGFATGWTTAFRAGSVDEFRHVTQGRAPSQGDVHVFRQE